MNPNDLERIKAAAEYGSLRFFGVPEPHTFRAATIFCYERYVYRTLAKILRDNQTTYTQKIDALILFLSDLWKIIHGSLVCHTTRPDSEITNLLCWLAEKLAAVKKVSPISILMPTVATKHLTDPSKNLDTLPLEFIIKRYLSTQDGTYLIPIDSAFRWKAASDMKKLVNPYYDYEVHASCYFSESDVWRAYHFSVESRKVLLAKEKVRELSVAQQGLFYHLTLLLEGLRQNSINGIGEEFRAGELVYRKITAFFDYYEIFLSPSDKGQIPLAVSMELQSLRDFCTPSYVLNADGSYKLNEAGKKILIPNESLFGSCLATRAKKLNEAMQSYQDALMLIGISGEMSRQLSVLAQAEYDSCEWELKTVIRKNSPTRLSHFPINKTLVLSVSLPIQVSFCIDEMHTMMPQDIEVFLSLPDVPFQVFRLFPTVMDVVPFLHTLSTERMKAFLQGMLTRLGDWIRYREDFFAALTTFEDEERFSIVFEILCKKLSVFNYDLFFVFSNLMPAQRFLFLEELKKHPLVIKNHVLPHKVFGELLRVEPLTQTEFQTIWDLRPRMQEKSDLEKSRSFEICAKNAVRFSKSSLSFILMGIHNHHIMLDEILVSLACSFSAEINSLVTAKYFFGLFDDVKPFESLLRLIVENKRFSEVYSPGFFMGLCCAVRERNEELDAVLYLTLRIIHANYCGDKKQVLTELMISDNELLKEIKNAISVGSGLGYGHLNTALSLLVDQVKDQKTRISLEPILEALTYQSLALCSH